MNENKPLDYSDYKEYNRKNNIPMFYCPLLTFEVDDSVCYDIQMVRDGFINESILDDYEEQEGFVLTLDRNRAEELCPYCQFNQLTGPIGKSQDITPVRTDRVLA
ncbi:MAG: hypothetical protein LBN42_03335 [Oscillospiraceae bacterium]|jgi:hypothetical protein|nr:hypothetical protein [Oscillospiraceae bacterium]